VRKKLIRVQKKSRREKEESEWKKRNKNNFFLQIIFQFSKQDNFLFCLPNNPFNTLTKLFSLSSSNNNLEEAKTLTCFHFFLAL